MSDQHAERDHQSDEEQDGDSKTGLLGAVIMFSVPIILILALFTLLFGFMGYMDYLEERGTEQACIERYGEGSEYVGDTGFASQTGVCDTPEGQKYVDIQTAPVSIGTFADYVTGGG